MFKPLEDIYMNKVRDINTCDGKGLRDHLFIHSYKYWVTTMCRALLPSRKLKRWQ